MNGIYRSDERTFWDVLELNYSARKYMAYRETHSQDRKDAVQHGDRAMFRMCCEETGGRVGLIYDCD